MFVFLIMSLVAKIKKTGKAKKMQLSAGTKLSKPMNLHI